VELVCTAIRERLVEAAGDPARLEADDLRHLEECSGCRAVAEAERGLVRLLEQAVPPEDPAVVRRVMASLRPARVRRRIVALVPVAASLVLALLGAAVLGGVPGSSLLSQLPLVSSHSWLAVANTAGDWIVGVAAASDAARLALPTPLVIGAVLAALAGLGVVVLATRRWHPVASWRRED